MVRSWLVLAMLAACGDDSGAVPDAPNGNGDASPDVPTQSTCNYSEQQDATNNTVAGAEPTGLTFGGPTVVCGTFDPGHYDGTNLIVDIDGYTLAVATDTDVLVHVTGAGAEALTAVSIAISSGNTRVGFGQFEGDHGTMVAHLPAGQYLLAAAAFNASATTSGLAYRLTLVADTPRCAKVTAAANYTEANDGAGSTGNDVMRFDEGATVQKTLTPSTADAPEPATVAVAAATSYRITGTSANVDVNADSYKDRDTYAITTGPTTNQLSIRLNWTGTPDLDYLVFRANTTQSFAGGLDLRAGEDEFETFAVKPNTTYWLWIGAYDTSTGLPATYDASLCGETYTP